MSSVSNLTNTILGAGMLGLPFALRSTGLIGGGFLMILSCMASMFGLHLLAESSARANERGISNYFIVASKALPKASPLIDFTITIKCFGVAVSYLIVIGQLMPAAVKHWENELPAENALMYRSFWIPISMLVVGPLSFLRRMDSLRFTSYIAIGSVGYVLGLILYFFLTIRVDYMSIGVKYFGIPDANLFSNLPIFVFAYTCHQNAFTIYNELKGDHKQVSMTFVISNTAALWVYCLIGFCGYLVFGDAVKNNILMNMPLGVGVLIGRLAVTILVALSYPLQIHPARICLTNLIKLVFPKIETNIGYYLLTFALCSTTFLVAFFLEDLGIVFSIIGATGSTLASYILPGLFYVMLEKQSAWHPKKVAALVLMISGILIMVNSLFWITYKALKD